MNKLFLSVAFFCFAARIYAGSATWLADPTSGDWNTAANWNPATVPNAPTDIATFATSDVTQLSFSSATTVDSIVFNPGADSFSLSATSTPLVFSGDGVVNESGQTQSFTFDGTPGSPFSVNFENSSSAGEATSYTLNGAGVFYFTGAATAGSANFVAEGNYEKQGGFYYVFIDWDGGAEVTAGNATFNLLHYAVASFEGGTAGNATFKVAGGRLNFDFHGDAGESIIDCSEGGAVNFFTNSKSAGTFHATAHGATGRKGLPGRITMGSDQAAAGTFVVEGGIGQQSPGGTMVVDYIGTLSKGNVTVLGGKSGGFGGRLVFRGTTDGGTAPISMEGNAVLDMSRHDRGTIQIGSVDGEGTIILGVVPHSIGTNNRDTGFSGVIQDGDKRPGFGPLLKVGTGTLTLEGANTYTGGTTLMAGGLVIANATGSGTGTGEVAVQAGTLAGPGVIAGATTIGTGSGKGAFLHPGKGASNPTTLTVQSALTLQSDGTYIWRVNTKKVKADEVVANGVTISGAQFDVVSVANQTLTPGTVFTAISNTASTPISGTFVNLADGAILTVGSNKLQASYEGGDGNDLTLTVVQ